MKHEIAEQARDDLNRLSELVTTRDLPEADLIDVAHRIQRLERIILTSLGKTPAAA